MPLVQVKVVRGSLSGEEKERLITAMTSAAAGVLGEDIRPHTWVVVEEVDSGSWGMGGNPITRDAVLSLRGVSFR